MLLCIMISSFHGFIVVKLYIKIIYHIELLPEPNKQSNTLMEASTVTSSTTI